MAFVLSVTAVASAQDPGAAPPAPEGAAPAPAEAAPAPAAAPPAAQPAPAPAPGYGPPPPMMGPPPPEDGGARTHDGFFLRLGLNFGPLILSAQGEANGQNVGEEVKYSGPHIGFDLLLGGSPVKGFALGGALIVSETKDPHIEYGSISGDGSGTLYVSAVGLFGDFYPDPHGGLHIQGLLGYAAVSAVSSSGNTSTNDPTGAIFGLGAGYDFWVGDEWSIGPFGRVLYSKLSYENGPAKVKWSYLYPSIGVAFTLH